MITNRKRNNYFAIRISDEELKLWEQKKRASGLKKTEYFIQLLKSSVIKVYCFNEALNNLCRELKKIGVNLNQIAYYCNAGYFPQAESEIKDIYGSYNSVMYRLGKFLDRPLVNAEIIESGEP